ncbi:Uncharacterised protein [Salmonella enterica subsp. enterica serovar Madelia]|nr:Uncharacterised protein [Salmonella enterica subsp. enterica serovar Madelia]
MVWRGRTIDGGAPERQPNPFTRYRTNTFAASERNLTAVVERNAGKNQHSVRGIHIIAAIFTNAAIACRPSMCGDSTFRHSVTPDGVTMET